MGSISRIYMELGKLNRKRMNNRIDKWKKNVEQTSLKRRNSNNY
jgi:hypothetical protein